MKFSQFTIISFLILFLKHYTYAYVDADADAERNTLENDNEHRYMIKFKHQQSYERSTSSLRSNRDPRLIMTLPDDKVEIMTLNTQEEVLFWEQHDGVEYVERDSKVYLQQQLETIPWGIEKVKALGVSDDNVSNQKVCIIDTGYDIKHPDLPSSKNVVSGTSQIPNQSWSEDGHGHGTHVAGTIAAIGGNNRGVVGINRNGTLKLHIVKIFNNDGRWSHTSDLIRAVEACVNAGSTVINMSLGGGNFSRTESDLYDKLYKEQNVILVASSGNSGMATKSYPASYESVISVGAVDTNNKRGLFSQYNDQVDITAPGVGIKSTYKGGTYTIMNGTSMSSPHVAGVVALIWSNFPTLSAQELRNALQSTAQDLGKAGRDDEYGHGLIRADLAYNFLAGNGNDDNSRGCEDFPASWYDIDGPTYNCEWYAQNDHCEKYGDYFVNAGKTANQACCGCGGGARNNL